MTISGVFLVMLPVYLLNVEWSIASMRSIDLYLSPAFAACVGAFDALAANISWCWIIYTGIAWELRRIVWILWWNSPKNVLVVGLPTPLGKWLTALRFVVDPESLMQQGYEEAQGRPFAIPTLDCYIVFVTKREHVNELVGCPLSVLSLKTALHELGFAKQVMAGLKQETDAENAISQKIFKNNLRGQIPRVAPEYGESVRKAVEIELEGRRDTTGSAWHRIPLAPAFARITARINTIMLVGEETSEEPIFFQVFMSYLEDAMVAFTVLQFTPALLTRVIGSFIMSWRGSMRKLLDIIDKLVAARLETKGGSSAVPHCSNCVHWIIQSSRIRDSREAARQILSFVFASGFQMPMLIHSAFYNMCKYPKYLPRLRAEAVNASPNVFDNQNRELPLLDSFLRETARLNPPTLLSCIRKVMVDFSFADGAFVPARNLVAVPQYSLMRDSTIWPNGDEFRGFRFVDKNAGKNRLTHLSGDLPFWGSVRQPCPGRFYFAFVAKMILAEIITNYDFKLEKPNITPAVSFGKARSPNPIMKIWIRRRSLQ